MQVSLRMKLYEKQLKKHPILIVAVILFTFAFGKLLADTFDIPDLIQSTVGVLAAWFILHVFRMDTRENIVILMIAGVVLAAIAILVPSSYGCHFISGQCSPFG